jgi:TetR/AcrR family transcriptional regulator, regulator of autoinduction and epiphytic fitness
MAEVNRIDGRKARGQRTRDAIVTAMLDLVGEGEFTPSAQQIAARSGVSVRSVYQHLADLESLYDEASSRGAEMIRSMASEIDPTWTLARRIEAFATNRATMLERTRSISRAGVLTGTTSAVVRENRQQLAEWARARVASIFSGDLATLPEPVADGILTAIEALSSASTWGYLRDTGYAPQAAHQVMQVGIAALLAGGRVEPTPGDATS